MVIDCRKIAQDFLDDVKKEIDILKQKNINPHLVIIKANNNPASEKYINNKIKKANELNIKTTLIVDDSKSMDNLINTIKKLNSDDNVHGVILQLPLYEELNPALIIKHLDSKKDVDGLTINAIANSWNQFELNTVHPCTAIGIIKMFDYLNYDLTGKHVVIVNKSNIVGKPLIPLLLDRNATVTVCHSKTKDLVSHTKVADVLITAVGISKFITKEMVNPNTFVVDVGISVDSNNKISGDADFDNLKDYVKNITPVPFGIGQLTVAMIFKNLIDLIKGNN